MLECWSEDPHGRPSFTHLKSKFELMLQLSASNRDQPYIELSLDTSQYLYIPDGIEEDDDPNKGVFTKPITSTRAAAHPPTTGIPESPMASEDTPTNVGQRQQEGSRHGVCLASMGSNNPYMECPRPASSTVNACIDDPLEETKF